MTNLEETRKQDLLSAWKKICAWTKENTAGKFPGGHRFHCPHHVYHWSDLVINEAGEARIYWGSHGSDNPEYVCTKDNIYGTTNGRFLSSKVKTVNSPNFSEEQISAASTHRVNFVAERFEEIIVRWPTFKAEILSEIAKNERIANFEP